MLKPLRIVLMLTLTVVSLSVAVYFVEDITSEIIATRQAEEIQEALQSIFPEIDGANDTITYVTDADFGITGIQQVIEITNNGNPKGYVYTVDFTGFASTIKYLIGIDAEGNITGFQVLAQGDTPGYGAQIADSANWEQFKGMSVETAGNGNFDGLSGATVTTTNWKASMEQVYLYHKDTYGFTPLTPEQQMVKRKEAIAGTSLSEYTNTNPFDSYGIQSVHIDADSTVVVYEVEFVGYNADDINQYVIGYDLATNEVVGFETIYSGDSTDFGAEKMYDTANWDQFDGQTSVDLLDPTVDGFSGASVTGNALEASLSKVAAYHRWEFEGEKELTPEEQFEAYKEALFPDAVRFEDVTAFLQASPIVTTVYNALDEDDNILGKVYHVVTIGASYSEITYIEFLVGIDVNQTFTGFYMVDDTETEGRTDGYYVDGYGDPIVGDDINADLDLDAATGATLSFNRIATALDQLVAYHIEYGSSRPDPTEVSNAALSAAYPTATTFVSVYENYDYNNVIGNIYEAQDGSGTVLGYVYMGLATGNGGAIAFTWGVAADGTTQQLHIISHGETWADAEEYANYDGSYGDNFATTSWFNLFEGIDIGSIITSPVATVSGVTDSTSGMVASLETIAEYHANQNVGGAN